jgi:hypothetical protein
MIQRPEYLQLVKHRLLPILNGFDLLLLHDLHCELRLVRSLRAAVDLRVIAFVEILAEFVLVVELALEDAF